LVIAAQLADPSIDASNRHWPGSTSSQGAGCCCGRGAAAGAGVKCSKNAAH